MTPLEAVRLIGTAAVIAGSQYPQQLSINLIENIVTDQIGSDSRIGEAATILNSNRLLRIRAYEWAEAKFDLECIENKVRRSHEE